MTVTETNHVINELIAENVVLHMKRFALLLLLTLSILT